jgi:hypothetical protein
MNGDALEMEGLRFRTVRGGHVGRLNQLLGAGGQGAVYSCTLGGNPHAVKWYHSAYTEVDIGLRARLTRAVNNGAPDNDFLWPLDLVEVDGFPGFGYLMRLRPGDYAGLRCLIARPPERLDPSLAVRARICLNIANRFLRLHSAGFCYQDINFGNIFFLPNDGSILICDNDNVDVNGMPAAVFGTRKFMAPEIVRREAMPSLTSDLFSMAVLFFYVFHCWHPLDGRRESDYALLDAEAEQKLYGTAPLFLFDPENPANGPVPGVHDPIVARWESLPPALRALFVRAFTSGLWRPGDRVYELEWRKPLCDLALSTVACPQCGFEHGGPRSGAPQPADMGCVACGMRIALPPRLAVGNSLFCLRPGTSLPRHVLEPSANFDMDEHAARVEVHPSRRDLLGLRNLGSTAWRARPGDGSDYVVPAGAAMRLMDGMTVDFGPSHGRVIVSAPQVANPA